MKGLQDLKGSIGRTASTKQAKRASILPDKSQPAEDTNAPAQSSGSTPASETTLKPGLPTPTQDMLAMWDAFARPPSQDISRPFDNLIPVIPVRASETGSLARQRSKRRSLVSAAPPTLGVVGVEQGGFGDAFKSFTQETTKPSPVPSISDTTLNTNPEPSTSTQLQPQTSADTTVRSASPRLSSSSSATPPKPTGIFKGLFRFKSKASSYWSPRTSENSSSEQIASKPVSTVPASPTVPTTPKIVVVDGSLEGLKEKNGSNSSLGLSSLSGSIRRLGRRSKDSRDSISEEKKESKKSVDESSEPPASPIPDDAKSARRYAHGVLLHPIVENEEDK